MYAKLKMTPEVIRSSERLGWANLHIDSDDCMVIAHVFRILGPLEVRELRLAFNDIDCSGIYKIVAAVQEGALPNLKGLHLQENRV